MRNRITVNRNIESFIPGTHGSVYKLYRQTYHTVRLYSETVHKIAQLNPRASLYRVTANRIQSVHAEHNHALRSNRDCTVGLQQKHSHSPRLEPP